MKNLILLTLALFSLNCNAQNNNNLQLKNNKKMEHFNIEQFEKNSGGTSEYRYTDEHGMEINQYYFPQNSGGPYMVECTYPNNPYKYQYIYNEEGNLVEKTNFFFTCDVGERIKYDNMGNVTEKIDCDAPYKFSIEKLKEKMQKEYNINILDTKKVENVNRYIDIDDNNKPCYVVSVYEAKLTPFKTLMDALFLYFIDGTTGKTLYKFSRDEMLRSGNPLTY